MRSIGWLLYLWVGVWAITGQEAPNIVVLLADDQGWGDLSFNGNKNLSTPNIDSLAHDGLHASAFYVCAVCAPTRAEFLTGRYHPRTGVQGVSEGKGRLNPDETTLADRLKAAGYATGIFGKWHNGTQPPYHPNDRGFDEFYGFTSGHWSHYFDAPMDHNGERVVGKGFIVDDITDHALAFIEQHKAEPFLCYVPFNTPHSPMMVPDRFYAPFAGKEITQRYRDSKVEDMDMTRAALALCENLDWNVGRILKQLDRLQLRENTMVLYFSDNGPNSYRWNGGMKGRKASVDEGGLRSPFFVRWPAKIPAGSNVENVIGAIDIYPTLLDAAGAESGGGKNLDGRSMLGLWTGANSAWPERPLFSTWVKKASVRLGRYRYDIKGMLYDLENDPGQRKNVVRDFPEQAARLRKLLAQHMATMQAAQAENMDRPFTVGYGVRTQLPARDAVPHGGIQRSSKAPNNSFLTEWTSDEQCITWEVDVGVAGVYEVTLYYTAAKENIGVTLCLSDGRGHETSSVVRKAFDPPLYDKSKERVSKSHYTMKPFRALSFGALPLEKGRCLLSLSASDLQTAGVVDVYALDLHRRE